MSKDQVNEMKLNQVITMLNRIIADSGVPRNIRRAAFEALRMLNDKSLSPGVRAANAVSALDEISQDPNMPSYARTMIWNIIAILSSIKD
ncbi:MAG: UPF0147 family protein [Sulfolobales archaeon]|nr:UPF0147 family protein [Sulfolobales archaeon]MCX8208814.1 UPF0147 family protein [Sulfolobales archaeon]MDW8011009.1 UPF0147 family protein [Sulfolobales archaeon]